LPITPGRADGHLLPLDLEEWMVRQILGVGWHDERPCNHTDVMAARITMPRTNPPRR